MIPLVNVRFMWLAKVLSRIKHNVPHALLRAYQIHSLYYNIWKTFQRNKTIIGTSQHSSCLSCLPLGPISFLTSKKSLTDTKLTRSSVQQLHVLHFFWRFHNFFPNIILVDQSFYINISFFVEHNGTQSKGITMNNNGTYIFLN